MWSLVRKLVMFRLLRGALHTSRTPSHRMDLGHQGTTPGMRAARAGSGGEHETHVVHKERSERVLPGDVRRSRWPTSTGSVAGSCELQHGPAGSAGIDAQDSDRQQPQNTAHSRHARHGPCCHSRSGLITACFLAATRRSQTVSFGCHRSIAQ